MGLDVWGRWEEPGSTVRPGRQQGLMSAQDIEGELPGRS